ncbi:AAA family ATPase [Bradyrhizobium liaoningense]|uniref:AAA family ATPase n=1 Tax=Bradyrhizobium liaoningense TaxID=43992 RepID=UPI001BA8FD21|nr:AAA family ATPase [Bradyrhizobium liaoningense]MBR0982378.1 AAA family ATPase [Bradyrhizobium liaoningense]
MRLLSAAVGPIKSIEKVTEVKIEEKVTVLVGMNESGKTVFLQALQKSDDVLGFAKFNPVDDYPRKLLNAYERRHSTNPDIVTRLKFAPSKEQIAAINEQFHVQLTETFNFEVWHRYDNQRQISCTADEKPVLMELSKGAELSAEYRSALQGAESLSAVPGAVEALSLTDADKESLAAINARIAVATKGNWPKQVVAFEIWQHLATLTPKFMYFGDYEVLPSKMNLPELARLAEESKTKPEALTSEHRGILALLRMANISVEAFADPGPIEALIARIEAVSIDLTDQIMEFWKQNEDLQVKIDIRPDPDDEAPFDDGPNLYIRIANNRHRGVTTPFKQRSRGFIWFFSFLVWFDSVKHQLAKGQMQRPLILLLDEPGLSLHALAQADFLRYIDHLAKKHQVIYSTHSPFMVHSSRLNEVRVVEDRKDVGTVISDNVSWTDSRTIFPLQAALGWTVAQNLFISEKNLLVEGAADLVYLQTVSSILESNGRVGLRDDVTIVPAGGLDKVVTFIALLGANNLRLAVFHDYRGTSEQKLLDVMREKLIASKSVLDASQFRDLAKLGVSTKPSDTEDLFETTTYLHYFNEAFKAQLNTPIKETKLPKGDRIVERIERYLETNSITLRPSGGYNHYTPASAFARDPTTMDANSLSRFEALFRKLNALFE